MQRFSGSDAGASHREKGGPKRLKNTLSGGSNSSALESAVGPRVASSLRPTFMWMALQLFVSTFTPFTSPRTKDSAAITLTQFRFAKSVIQPPMRERSGVELISCQPAFLALRLTTLDAESLSRAIVSCSTIGTNQHTACECTRAVSKIVGITGLCMRL